MANFCRYTNFQKTIISILASFKTQKEELDELKNAFRYLDKDKNGSISKQELRIGLKNV